MKTLEWTISEDGRHLDYGPLGKREHATITHEPRDHGRGDWQVSVSLRARLGESYMGGPYRDLSEAKKQVEAQVAAVRKETAAKKKTKAPKREPSPPNPGDFELDYVETGDERSAKEILEEAYGVGKKRRKVEPKGEAAPEPAKLPEAPKTPRMQELLDLEADVRAALDAIENEHKIELHEDEPPRCGQLYEHEQDGELSRTTEELEVPLTKEEQFLAGQEAATALFAQRRLDDLKKFVNGTLKSLIDRYEERVLSLLGRVDTGKASVPVSVVTVRASATHAAVYRADTWKVLRRRELTADEKQLRLT